MKLSLAHKVALSLSLSLSLSLKFGSGWVDVDQHDDHKVAVFRSITALCFRQICRDPPSKVGRLEIRY